MFDSTILNLLTSLPKNPWKNVAKIFPCAEVITYYKKPTMVKMYSTATKVNPVSALVDAINSKKMLANVRKLTLIQNCEPISGYTDRNLDAKTKTRGLFEYKFDSITTIDSILDN